MTAQPFKLNDRRRTSRACRNSCAAANEENKFVAAAKNGDSLAFGVLFKQSAGMVFNIARRMMPTHEDAEDVVQESFQLAFTHLQSFKGDSRFSTWLTRIVTNAALMRLRKNKARHESPLDEFSEPEGYLSRFDIQDRGPNPEQLYARKERHRILRKAINQLTPKVRRAIELRDLDERSTAETARMMRISIGSVKARTFHGRQKLNRLLKRMNLIGMCGNKSLRWTRKPKSTPGQQVVYSTGD